MFFTSHEISLGINTFTACCPQYIKVWARCSVSGFFLVWEREKLLDGATFTEERVDVTSHPVLQSLLIHLM